ncbi:MAG: class I SAM-dependent methyltransferase [Nocardioidaceae bacterium]
MTMHDMELGTVRAGWERIDVLERLPVAQAASVFAPSLDSERARSRELFEPLKLDARTAGYRRSYESPSNLVRFRRTVDFLEPGERVFEIGIGMGYLAGMMLRDGKIGGYHGIDIVERNVTGTRGTLEANGFADRGTAEVGDLYEVSREEVEAFGADLVVCCEVLEHVPDPEHALQVLADALPDGADLLISVPLLHRLETVWGHVAIFGCARVREMVEAAGLHAHLVEAVDNTWVFILASRSPEPSAHAARAEREVPDITRGMQSPPDRPRAVHNVAPAAQPRLDSLWTKRLSRADVDTVGDKLVCAFDSDPAADGNSYGGLRFAVSGIRGVRLELGLDDIETVNELYVDFMAGKQRVGRWRWEVASGRPKANPATFLLRPEFKGKYFRRGIIGDLSTADSIELFAALAPGGRAHFTLSRMGLVV